MAHRDPKASPPARGTFAAAAAAAPGKRAPQAQPATTSSPVDPTVDVRDRNIYIASLPNEFDRDKLAALFAPFGPVESARFVAPRHGAVKALNKGYGFVLMKQAAHAQASIAALDRSIVDKHRVQVRLSHAEASEGADRPPTKGGAVPTPSPAAVAAPAKDRAVPAAPQATTRSAPQATSRDASKKEAARPTTAPPPAAAVKTTPVEQQQRANTTATASDVPDVAITVAPSPAKAASEASSSKLLAEEEAARNAWGAEALHTNVQHSASPLSDLWASDFSPAPLPQGVVSFQVQGSDDSSQFQASGGGAAMKPLFGGRSFEHLVARFSSIGSPDSEDGGAEDQFLLTELSTRLSQQAQYDPLRLVAAEPDAAGFEGLHQEATHMSLSAPSTAPSTPRGPTAPIAPAAATTSSSTKQDTPLHHSGSTWAGLPTTTTAASAAPVLPTTQQQQQQQSFFSSLPPGTIVSFTLPGGNPAQQQRSSSALPSNPAPWTVTQSAAAPAAAAPQLMILSPDGSLMPAPAHLFMPSQQAAAAPVSAFRHPHHPQQPFQQQQQPMFFTQPAPMMMMNPMAGGAPVPPMYYQQQPQSHHSHFRRHGGPTSWTAAASPAAL